jgi:transposase
MADAMLTDRARLVTGGIDTHKDVHVAAVVDGVGAEIATRAFPTTAAGYQSLAQWLGSHGELGRVGVEGCGSWGAGIARYLTEIGVGVVEINRPNRQMRRNRGKSDPLDAVAAARAALAGVDAGTPKSAVGSVESIRMLRITRRSAVRARTRTMNQIRAVIDTAVEPVRDRYRSMTPARLVKALTATRPDTSRASEPAVAAAIALKHLGARWRFLTDQINTVEALLDTLVAATAPGLIALPCVGTDTAAALLIAAGDNPDRLGSEAAFAALCGTNPLPASSGRTVRHRLNRAGNRDANNALWRIVMSRMAHDHRTRDYVERRTTEGLSKREIIRCLKRYVAREIYPILIADLTTTT